MLNIVYIQLCIILCIQSVVYLQINYPSHTQRSNGSLLFDLELPEICDAKWPQSIVCQNYDNFDLRAEFMRISYNHSDEQKHFEKLLIENVTIEELPENVFYQILFAEIKLYKMSDLVTINSNAFNGTSNSIEKVELNKTTSLVNNPPNGDLFAAISSLNNLKSVQIELASDVGHEIPLNAFKQINGPQISLENITFSGSYWISRINDNAFSAIPNLVNFRSLVPIEYITSNAFNFETPSAFTFYIYIILSGCSLKESSFGDNVFSGSQRPLYIDLSDNEIRYFSENSFRAFFDINTENTISIWNNSLECDNISEFEWLLRRRTELEHRFLSARCSNGNDFWDLELPEICDAKWPQSIVCQSYNDFDLRAEFMRISYNQSDEQKHFEKLLIENVIIKELPENVFYQILFNEIKLYKMSDLVTINSNAFNGTLTSVERLELNETTSLVNNPLNDDLYAAISSLNNLKSVQIELASDIGHEIPVNAFKQINGPQITLENITMSGSYWISRINDNAFSAIPNLVNFRSLVPIEYITSNAFNFGTPSAVTTYTYIILSGCSLKESSFGDNVFSGSQRPLYLDLSDNEIRYFSENSFRAFFDNNAGNIISLWNTFLECDDISVYEWLLRRRTELEHRFLSARCSNGTDFWDLVAPEIITTKMPSKQCREAKISDFKSNISTLFSSIALTCLILTCILSKSLRKKRTTNDESNDINEKFTFNFTICLSVINIYIIFEDHSTDIEWLCQLWSLLIYYVYMTAFLWMLLKSYYLHRITAKIFPNFYTINYFHYAITFGAPILLCILIIAIKWLAEKNHLENDDFLNIIFDFYHKDCVYFCWLSTTDNSDQFWILICPGLLLLTVSLCFISVSLRNLMKYSKHNLLHRDNKWIYGFILNFFLFLISWIMWNLHTKTDDDYYLYIFAVSNCFQAIAILIYESLEVYRTVIVTPNTTANTTETNAQSNSG